MTELNLMVCNAADVLRVVDYDADDVIRCQVPVEWVTVVANNALDHFISLGFAADHRHVRDAESFARARQGCRKTATMVLMNKCIDHIAAASNTPLRERTIRAMVHEIENTTSPEMQHHCGLFIMGHLRRHGVSVTGDVIEQAVDVLRCLARVGTYPGDREWIKGYLKREGWAAR